MQGEPQQQQQQQTTPPLDLGALSSMLSLQQAATGIT
jgi:hypothetical protein